ncbi:hypothetical protein M413DRAFT_440719 [Hebeloma cylindrosporum]|uniref:N-acetyltransferase domain-containing protein n=1 Tax=Hebeloma cylindrosporum TaxID=76867 RepID=A0A0C3CEN7_HEBCY|nr:hypothetical protein M413DRAFT_440719 [Hebeloma cylindrosporum h7]
MAAIELSVADCIPKFTTEKHYQNPKRMQYLSVKLMHPTLGELAYAVCLQINSRAQFKNAGDFLEVMDEDSQETQCFSMALFDKYSNIRPWLVDGGSKSGSGCWGTELSEGDMLYIVDLTVKDEYRSRGVGSYLLQKILASYCVGHAFCWPTPIASNKPKAEWAQEQADITAFYRKNGFRRVGLTSFLAYSPDSFHPSRNLPIASDPETPSIAFDSANPTAPTLTLDELHPQYPLHFRLARDKSPSIVQTIRAAYQIDAGDIHRRDVNGFLPIHIAAASENVHEFDMVEDLKDSENDGGVTPLEGLEVSMRIMKEIMDLRGVWKGHSDEALICEYLLKNGTGGEAEYVKKNKFGCTCGMCTDGWLSPRMRFQLLVQSEIQGDMLREFDTLFQPRQPLSASELFNPVLFYLPKPLQRGIYKTFYIGFYTLFDGMAQILRTPNAIPTPQAVITAAFNINPSAVQFYLRKGGKVEYVLDALVDIAKQQSSLGDGTFGDTFDVEEAEDAEHRLGYRKLVVCANDLEFGLVRLGVGLTMGGRWGPFGSLWEREMGMGMEMDVDGDSDSDSDSDSG